MAKIQRTPYPPWCDGERCRESDARDRFHEHLGPVLSAVFRTGAGGQSSAGLIRAGELQVGAFTSALEPDEVWVGIDEGEVGRGLTLTLETAQRLVRELERVVTPAGGSSS